jgi:hypothetical protein
MVSKEGLLVRKQTADREDDNERVPMVDGRRRNTPNSL